MTKSSLSIVPNLDHGRDCIMSKCHRISCKNPDYADGDVLLIGYTEDEVLDAAKELEEAGNQVDVEQEDS